MAAESYKRYRVRSRPRHLRRAVNYNQLYQQIHPKFRAEDLHYFEKGVATMEETSSHSQLVSTDFKDRDEHNYLIEKTISGENVYCSSGTKLCERKTGFEDWIHNNFENYVIGRDCNGVAYKTTPNGGVRFDFAIRRGNLDYTAFGNRADVIEFEAWLESQGFSTEGISIVWAFGSNYREMETFQLPLQMPKPLTGAYPWINKSVEKFTQEFLASKASILILIGPPGTGKTTFIKEMIKEADTGAMVTYDTDLLFTDGFFASFMTNEECNLLVLEDADTVMGARKDGNTMMHKFLNASDGLVSLSHKKIIFTTNLPSINDVDPALLRKGRCFDIIHARNLSRDEAQVVADQLYPEKITLDKDKYSLAEVTNLTSRDVSEGIRRMGF